MPTSLGLTGDLDDVECIQDVEEAFGVRFSDDELNRCWTVGDLYKLIEAELPADPGDRCATAMCFYRLRRALQPAIATKLQPKTPIDALRALSVRKLHRIIKESGLRPPVRVISLWGCVALLSIPVLPIATMAYGLSGWVVASSAVVAIALAGIAPIRLPPDLTTFGDLVRIVASRSIGALAEQGARLSRVDAWEAFKDILGEYSLLPKDEITPDTLILAPQKAAS